MNQYPDAGALIYCLPASCFKPEAHLLIERFLSLKKGKSRDIFISNMKDHTIRVRYQVSSILS